MWRFMSPDPSQLYFADPENPQSMNVYTYVSNNPVNRLEMSCDCWKECKFKIRCYYNRMVVHVDMLYFGHRLFLWLVGQWSG
jgi:hypothetical protein